jgi:23S rRNA (uracil1939-C5)-methyltransferase
VPRHPRQPRDSRPAAARGRALASPGTPSAGGVGRATVTIRSLSSEGDGVATLDGRVVEVPATLPGERVEIEWRELRDGRRVANVVRLLEVSPHRVTPACRHFGPCGGCTWQHVSYAEQLRLKQQRLQALLDSSLGRGVAQVLPTLGTPRKPEPPAPGPQPPAPSPDPDAPWQFRNKVHFVFAPGQGREPLVMGHYRRGSRSVIPVEECPVHAEPGNQLAFQLRDELRRAGIPGCTPDVEQGIARHVVVRVGESEGTQLVTLVVAENIKPLRGVSARFSKAVAGDGMPRVGLHVNVHGEPSAFLFGPDTLHVAGADALFERVAGIRFIVGPLSFFQTNVQAAAVLVDQVLSAVGPESRRILDLYAGVGLFSLPLAAEGTRLVRAVEENREAVQNAHATRRVNRVPDSAFAPFAGPVEGAVARFTPRAKEPAWDAVILDPPRAGCPPAVLDWVYRTLAPARIVYVSCNPEALARDLKGAVPAGYRITRVQPVDMFPHTAHLETVVLMERKARRAGL